jgi:glycogen operon protein
MFLSQGVPMLLAGDAIGHTQQGNNNAYCQDNEISWIDWSTGSADLELLAFARKMIALRKQHPVFRRRNFFQGRSIKGADIKDILWLQPDGTEMTDEQWKQDSARSMGVFLSGQGLGEQDDRGQPVSDQNFLMLMNAHHDAIPFTLPPLPSGAGWVTIVDTSCQTTRDGDIGYRAGDAYPLQARSLALLVEREEGQLRLKDRRREA